MRTSAVRLRLGYAMTRSPPREELEAEVQSLRAELDGAAETSAPTIWERLGTVTVERRLNAPVDPVGVLARLREASGIEGEAEIMNGRLRWHGAGSLEVLVEDVESNAPLVTVRRTTHRASRRLMKTYTGVVGILGGIAALVMIAAGVSQDIGTAILIAAAMLSGVAMQAAARRSVERDLTELVRVVAATPAPRVRVEVMQDESHAEATEHVTVAEELQAQARSRA